MQPTFFESTPQQKQLADIGGSMMDWSENYGKLHGLKAVTDNGLRTLNELSHVGYMLTTVGATFGAAEVDFDAAERKLIVDFMKKQVDIERKGQYTVYKLNKQGALHMTNVMIKEGTYKIRGKETCMQGLVFPLVEEFKVGAGGGYVTVDGSAVNGFPARNIKIKVSGVRDYTVVGDEVAATIVEESDTEIVERIRERFDMLKDMTKAVKKGDVRAMIVSGPPGVGKSHGVEEVLDRYALMESLGAGKQHEVIKGATSAIGLYCKLFKMADKGKVVVFDDCDSIFADELSLNILKAALDSKKNRYIHWNTDSFKLRNEGVPDSFKFEASAIFITNLKFDKVKGKLREHLEALESRCHYMDLTIDSDKDKILRIKQVVQDGMLDKYKLADEVKEEIMDFIDINKGRLRELSLRTVLKVADLAISFPDRWESYAENTVMRRA